MSEDLPPVTIGIPFYNAEDFLIEAIRSVFAQSHVNWELILIDDGSTDSSLEIARSVDDPRVRVYSDGKNLRLAARLNEICSLATYDFIARMDADDLMATDRISKQLDFLMNNPHLDLVSTGACSITDDSVPYGFRMVSSTHVLTQYSVLSGAHGIVHASVLGRKEWFLRNPYDPNDVRGQDYNLWVRAACRSDLSVGFIREPAYYYREEGSMTPHKMLLGQKGRRRALVRHGMSMVGCLRAFKLYIISLSKTAVIGLASFFGMTKHIVRRRSASAATSQLEAVRQDIRNIEKTAVLVKRSVAASP